MTQTAASYFPVQCVVIQNTNTVRLEATWIEESVRLACINYRKHLI